MNPLTEVIVKVDVFSIGAFSSYKKLELNLNSHRNQVEKKFSAPVSA